MGGKMTIDQTWRRQNSGSFGSNTENQYTRSLQYSMCIQDDWKVSPTVTANDGVRYNAEPPKTYKGGYSSLFDLDIPNNSNYTNRLTCPSAPRGWLHGLICSPRGHPVR